MENLGESGESHHWSPLAGVPIEMNNAVYLGKITGNVDLGCRIQGHSSIRSRYGGVTDVCHPHLEPN